MSTSGQKANILLVDDQPSKLVALSAVIEDLNENIVSVNSGLKALEFLLKNDCAVIVLDVNMPGMDGFEAASLIRQRPSLERTPIIFVSAYNVSDLDRLKGYGIGAVDYLFVPVVPAVLKAKVQVFVEVFRQKQVIREQANHLGRQNLEKEQQIQVIQELNEKLKAANDELETFSYSISHDLRGPLRAMHGFSEALLTDLKDTLRPQDLDYLTRIKGAANRMDNLIRDILDYSRVLKEELSLQRVDLDQVVTGIVQNSDPLRAPNASVILERPLHNVIAHEPCLIQCLSNLMLNAVKFVAKGQKPEIRIRTDLEGANVRIWVQDNGIGIDPAYHSRIFQMFSRVHNGSHYEGTGIGLTIVKKGVERMGGSVGVESTPGHGSKFWIQLPTEKTESTTSRPPDLSIAGT